MFATKPKADATMPRKKKADNVPQETVLDAAKAEAPATEAGEAKAAAPKRTAKPKEMEVKTILQYFGFEWDLSKIKEKVIASFVSDGHRRGNIKKLTLYLKPEDRMAYYVINDKVASSVDFDA